MARASESGKRRGDSSLYRNRYHIRTGLGKDLNVVITRIDKGMTETSSGISGFVDNDVSTTI